MNTTRFNARRTVLQAIAAVSLGAALVPAAFAAEAFPNKPITMVVPFVAGGTTDILARIGGQFAARAPSDGYTIFMGTVGTHAINEWLYKKMPFSPNKDFAPLTRVANVPNLLVANPAQPFKNVKELISYAQAHPGQVNFGSSGSGSSIHLSGELFKMMAKVDMIHIPYKGSAPAVTDLLGNQIAIMFDNMPSAIQHVRSGKLRPLAVTTAKRSPELPDVPTVAEAGVPGYEATSWFGLFAPTKTPADVQAKLHAAIIKVLQKPDVIKKIGDQGGEVVTESQAEFGRFIAAENEKWKQVVKTSGATAG